MKKIAILTSGGDSQGMSLTVISAIQACRKHDIQPFIVQDGFYGLCHGLIKPAPAGIEHSYNYMNNGGTFIGTSRFKHFVDLEWKLKAITELKKFAIDGLIVIGGNGSYQGAMSLHELGFSAVGVPGTIDNDINTTDFTIGFDTTSNVVLECLDRLRDTAESHNRCIIVEVMGRQCGDIALFAGIAAQVDVIVTSEHLITEDEIIQRVKKLKDINKRSVIVLVTENLFNVNVLAQKVEKISGYICRANILGHQQRGGRPTIRDRFYAYIMADKAVELLLSKKSGNAVTLNGLEISKAPLNDFTKYKNKIHNKYFNVFNKKRTT